MTKRYYSLRFERSDALHHAGEQVLNADNLLHIGQTEACEVRLTNESQYEDAVIAVIKKRDDGSGWNLIRISPYQEHEVRVDGTSINYVHLLEDGDRIAFEGQRQELVFHIHEDEQYTSNKILSVGNTASRTVSIWLTVVSLVLLGFAAHVLYNRPMSNSMIESAQQSVFQISVDYIELVECRGDSTFVKKVAHKGTDFSEDFGTAFLTTDGCLVTARHCIEPWLNLPEGTKMDTAEPSTPLPVKMALEAVTRNIRAESEGNDSTRWVMVSHCLLSRHENSDSILMRPLSTQFEMNISRDNIVEYGDFSHQYLWRSIKVRPRRSDMMLGDIAFLPHAADSLPKTKGNIRMATKEEIHKLCGNANRQLVIMGRKSIETEDKQVQSPEAHLKLKLKEDNYEGGYPNSVIAHDGGIDHGFSGGPVLTRIGFNGWCAIGVVSVTDKNNDNWYYSVPITEIDRMKTKQN